MKKTIITWIHAACFLAVLAIVISLISNLVQLKSPCFYRIKGFYEEPMDSLDIVFIGSSMIYCHFPAAYIYDEFGLTSYPLSSSSQKIESSYLLLKEASAYQKNAIFVVDVWMSLTDPKTHIEKYGEENYLGALHSVMDPMRFLPNKPEAIFQTVPEKSRLSFLFPLSKYHVRWTELTASDFQPFQTDPLKGYLPNFNIEEQPLPQVIPANEIEKISAFSLSFIDQMIAFSKENGLEIIFINAPHVCTDQEAAQIDFLEQHITSQAIPFINFANDPGIVDYSTDFYDKLHLNYWGTEKYSHRVVSTLLELYPTLSSVSHPNNSAWELSAQAYAQLCPTPELPS